MDMKEILHRVLSGMCPHLSCGVPDVYWYLALDMTRIVYGYSGTEVIKKFHKVNDGSVEADSRIDLHVLEGWEDGGNTFIGPEEVIAKLESNCI